MDKVFGTRICLGQWVCLGRHDHEANTFWPLLVLIRLYESSARLLLLLLSSLRSRTRHLPTHHIHYVTPLYLTRILPLLGNQLIPLPHYEMESPETVENHVILPKKHVYIAALAPSGYSSSIDSFSANWQLPSSRKHPTLPEATPLRLGSNERVCTQGAFHKDAPFWIIEDMAVRRVSLSSPTFSMWSFSKSTTT
jgi:hypothetical protein